MKYKKTCRGCANDAKNNNGCVTMVSRPREDKFCYQTKEDAIKAEEAIIEYGFSGAGGEPTSHTNALYKVAKNRVEELKQLNS